MSVEMTTRVAKEGVHWVARFEHGERGLRMEMDRHADAMTWAATPRLRGFVEQRLTEDADWPEGSCAAGWIGRYLVRDELPARSVPVDLLGDVLKAMDGERRVRVTQIRRRLAEQRPDVYDRWSPQRFTTALDAAASGEKVICVGHVDGASGQRYVDGLAVVDAIIRRSAELGEYPLPEALNGKDENR